MMCPGQLPFDGGHLEYSGQFLGNKIFHDALLVLKNVRKVQYIAMFPEYT